MPYDGEDRWFNTPHRTVLDRVTTGYVDYTDAIAVNKQLYLDFYHTPSRNSMAFKAFITDYSETYEVNYDTQDVYGRQDPFSSYIRTQRRISLSWDTVAASQDEAEENYKRCTELIQMMYPSYKKRGKRNHYVVNEGPRFRVRFSNWMVDSTIKGGDDGPGAFDWADTSGLLCQIENLQFNPDLDAGSYDTKEGVFPKVIRLSCAIVPYTPSGPQWEGRKKKGGTFKHFPFGYSGYNDNEGEKGPPPLSRESATPPDAPSQTEQGDERSEAVKRRMVGWPPGTIKPGNEYM